ncbi:MAG: carboxylesterase/lipase family protein, partial [Giesbergeria sp.]
MITPRFVQPLLTLLVVVSALSPALCAQDPAPVRVQTRDGTVEGLVSADGRTRVFKGIPYAAPPVGALRWQPPQPVEPWIGVRPARDFAPRAMQVPLWPDMIFHDAGPSEDCLYLNVWAPSPSDADGDDKRKARPVMFWIHGGGFVAGGSSEPRQEGSRLAQEDVVVVSLNYRMGVFGFLAHPELAAESPAGAAGNYGLLDMIAALRWVRDNIGAFGGDPAKVTIFGESAGSMAVSALMASPEARGLFHRAIGQSGSALGRGLPALAESAAAGQSFGAEIGAPDLAALRALPAEELVQLWAEAGMWSFRPNLDGLFFTAHPLQVFARGEQAAVPLLAGWNLDEGGPGALTGRAAPTLANFRLAAHERFGLFAPRFLEAYSASNDAEAARAAADYGGDRFIASGTWQWLEEHQRTSGQPVYRYLFDHLVPLNRDLAGPDEQPRAAHSWDIEYVFNVLDSKNAPWTEADHQLAGRMAAYWANFAKHGDPNGDGLPAWPAYTAAHDHPVMHLNP